MKSREHCDSGWRVYAMSKWKMKTGIRKTEYGKGWMSEILPAICVFRFQNDKLREEK